MKQRFQNLVTTGRFTLPVAVMLAAAFWLLAYLLCPDEAVAGTGQTWLSFLVYAIIGFLLIQFNNLFAIIRVRASVQTSFYILLVAVCPALHCVTASDIATVFFLAALFLLFSTYRMELSAGRLFLAFASVGLGSLCFPQLTYFAPVLWLGAYDFQSLTPKSFFASLLGWALPYWFLLGYGFCFDRMGLFLQPFYELATFTPIVYDFPLWMWAVLGYSLLLFVVSTAHCLAVSYDDKIQTRSYLQFLMLLTLYTFIYMSLQPSLAEALLPLLFIGNSILSGHLFALTRSRASNLFFIFALAALLGLFVFNLLIIKP